MDVSLKSYRYFTSWRWTKIHAYQINLTHIFGCSTINGPENRTLNYFTCNQADNVTNALKLLNRTHWLICTKCKSHWPIRTKCKPHWHRYAPSVKAITAPTELPAKAMAVAVVRSLLGNQVLDRVVGITCVILPASPLQNWPRQMKLQFTKITRIKYFLMSSVFDTTSKKFRYLPLIVENEIKCTGKTMHARTRRVLCVNILLWWAVNWIKAYIDKFGQGQNIMGYVNCPHWQDLRDISVEVGVN